MGLGFHREKVADPIAGVFATVDTERHELVHVYLKCYLKDGCHIHLQGLGLGPGCQLHNPNPNPNPNPGYQRAS